MISKIKACLRALANTSTARIIDGRYLHALFREMEGHGGDKTIIEK